MMVKTITIRDDVYHELASTKDESDSFSEAILKLLSRKRTDMSAFFGVFKEMDLWVEIEEEISEERKRARLRSRTPP